MVNLRLIKIKNLMLVKMYVILYFVYCNYNLCNV